MRNPELLERRLNKLNVIFKNLHFLLNRVDSTKEQFENEIKSGEEMVEEIRKLVLDFDRRVKEEDFYPPDNPNDAISIWEKAELDREPIELPEEAEDYVDMLQLANASLKKWEGIKEKSTASLMALLEENEIGYSWTVKDGERVCTQVKWPTINYKAREERIVPAKEAYSVRQKTLKIKEMKYENN